MALAAGGPAPAGLSEKERAAFDSLDTFFKKYRAYGVIMGTRPQAIGYSLADSPVGLAAWIFDYNNGEPARRLNRDDVLDNFSLYWLTNTAGFVVQVIYWENRWKKNLTSATSQMTNQIKVPVATPVFPDEVIRAQESWARKAFPSLNYFNEVDKGGHFAMWEYPELFSREDPRGVPAAPATLIIKFLQTHIDKGKEPLMKTKSIIAAAALALASSLAPQVAHSHQRAAVESAHGATQGETVTVAADKPIPNLPGKRLVSLIVDYAPGGSTACAPSRQLGFHLRLRPLRPDPQPGR